MKKFIGLMVLLMTIVTLSASAQCPTVVTKPRVVGDWTPCKNQKNVVYTLTNDTWKWCYGYAGVLPQTGFVPTQFQWNVDPNSGAKISDGITTSNTAGILYTTQTAVAISYKTKNTYVGVSFKDSCGAWQPLGGTTATLSCLNDSDPYVPSTPTGIWNYDGSIRSVVDTGVTIINADVNHATYNMYLDFDSISGLAGPHIGINVYTKIVGASCATLGGNYFPDGYYQQTRQTPCPNLPFSVAYGWSYYYASATTPPRTFRVSGVSANGTPWFSLPFTISTTVPSNINYPTLP